jgi:hypothetical protein
MSTVHQFVLAVLFASMESTGWFELALFVRQFVLYNFLVTADYSESDALHGLV